MFRLASWLNRYNIINARIYWSITSVQQTVDTTITMWQTEPTFLVLGGTCGKCDQPGEMSHHWRESRQHRRHPRG